MARSYLPSKVSEIVSIWRNDLNKVNKKAAESLADPQVCPNLFEDWGIHPPVDVSTPHFTSSNSIEVGSADCVCN
ncbi:coatomer subunit beta'-1-like isoform X4 [Pyrus x bretschneideri]|uniref:coatomer subunit beta'-1-like n=1 Tax=Pyrus x bretschneideri TaxID=225117 RepID=UPI00202FC24D|nr:coatomer subunit beta'-1-like [Pyrus x bretschneideri]XP_048444071.1 coatomer subunit beta'-1-like isoform X4 [Pyrus x bretschneideri]